MLFSQILASSNIPGQQLYFIKNTRIELEVNAYTIQHAFTFENCEFIHAPNYTGVSSLLYSMQGLRFENCIFKIGICFKGLVGNSELLSGPNLFITNCMFKEFQSTEFPGKSFPWLPTIQITGHFDDVQVKPDFATPLGLTISNCKFQTLRISGSYSNLQFVEYEGKELWLTNFSCNSFWFREKLNLCIPFVDVDEVSVANLASTVAKSNQNSMFNTSIRMLLEVLSSKKEGSKFIQLNEGLCTHYSKLSYPSFPQKIQAWIIYGFFRNFYAITPWIILSLILVLAFSAIFFCFPEETFVSAFLNSFFSFSGNPPNDVSKSIILNMLSAFEAYVGIFFILILSFVFSRKYSNYF